MLGAGSATSEDLIYMQDRYYGEKLGINPKDPSARRKAVEHFVQVMPFTAVRKTPLHQRTGLCCSARVPDVIHLASLALWVLCVSKTTEAV
jgi:hypothetical protein